MHISKKSKQLVKMFDKEATYSVDSLFPLIKNFPAAKFVESVDVDVMLGIDVKKSDQVVRGSVVLPNGTGKNVLVAVFADTEHAKEAKDAGADFAGLEELVDQIQKTQKIHFDLAIAHPSVMPKIGKIARILGSKGVMPNAKNGTLTTDLTKAIKNAKTGQVNYRADKFGIVHASIGRADFSDNHLKENLSALIGALKKSKPATSKGVYLKKICVSTTMGPGLKLDVNSLTV